jgi:hypothetical protein
MGIIFMNVCFVITVTMVMLLRDFGPCGTIFMTRAMCLLIVRLITPHHIYLTITKTRKERPRPHPGCCATDNDDDDDVFTTLDIPVILDGNKLVIYDNFVLFH